MYPCIMWPPRISSQRLGMLEFEVHDSPTLAPRTGRFSVEKCREAKTTYTAL
jgi:hypothetical protein